MVIYEKLGLYLSFLKHFFKKWRSFGLFEIVKRNLIQAFKPAPLSKGDSNKGVFKWNLQIFLQDLFHRTPLTAASVASFPAGNNELIKKMKN